MMFCQYSTWDLEMFEAYESRRKKRKMHYKKKAQARRRAMYGVNHEKNLKESLLEAAFSAKMVSEREIISEAKVRRGEFVTCLRREIKYRGINGRYNALIDKDNWRDILVPTRSTTFDPEIMKTIADVRREVADDSSPIAIERGIKALDRRVDGAIDILKEIENINDEAEEVINGFKQLATEM